MRRVLATLAVLAAVAGHATTAGAATGTLRLALSPGASFPGRQFTVDLPPGVGVAFATWYVTATPGQRAREA